MYLAHPGIALWMPSEQHDYPDAERGGATNAPIPPGSKEWWEYGGWPFVERAVAELNKPSHLRLDLSQRQASAPMHHTPPASPLLGPTGSAPAAPKSALKVKPKYGAIAAACIAPRGPLLTPQALTTLLTSGQPPRDFNGKDADRDLASKLYLGAFNACAPQLSSLDLHGQWWGVDRQGGSSSSSGWEMVLKSFPSLTRLDVSGTYLSSDNLPGASLAKALTACPNLTTLIASGTILGESSVQELMALQSASKLTHLALDGCGLRDSAVEVLLATLSGKSGDGLTTLSLRDNTIGADGCASLVAFLQRCPTLTSLDASCNALTGGGGEQSAALDLLHVALSPTSPIISLMLGGNCFGDETATLICMLLPSNTTLTCLDVRSEELSPGSATKLADGILSAGERLHNFGGIPLQPLAMGALTSLDLAGACLGHAEAYVLGELALSSMPVLYLNVDGHELLSVTELRGEPDACTECDLSHAGLGTASAIVIATLISANTVITTLNLSNNRLGARAVSAIAEALPLQTTLTHLDLSGNSIGVDGAKALSEALIQVNCSVHTIALEGAHTLPVRALRGSEPSRTLKLERRNLGHLSAVFIAGLVRVHPSLTALSLAENHLGPKGCTAIINAMRHNKVRGPPCTHTPHIYSHFSLSTPFPLQQCTSLDVSNNDIGREGALAIGNHLILHEKACLLSLINLDGFQLPVRKLRGTGADDPSALPGSISSSTAKPVDNLDLHKKKLGPLSALVIGQLIRSNPHLTNLSLAGNNLGVAGAVAIAEATAANTRLSTVDIRHNKLDAEAKATVRTIHPLAVSGRLLISTPDSDRGENDAHAALHSSDGFAVKKQSTAKTMRTSMTKASSTLAAAAAKAGAPAGASPPKLGKALKSLRAVK